MATSRRPEIARGEIWLVALDPVVGSERAKTRPCIVVQRDVANSVSRTTIVVPITDAVGQSATVIKPRFTSGDGGLKKPSVALCQQVRTVDRLRFRKRLGLLSSRSMALVSLGLSEILDIA